MRKKSTVTKCFHFYPLFSMCHIYTYDTTKRHITKSRASSFKELQTTAQPWVQTIDNDCTNSICKSMLTCIDILLNLIIILTDINFFIKFNL